MIEIDQARQLVLERCEPLPTTRQQVVAAIGFTLAEDVVSDVNSPPHDKALVDGFAVRVSDAGKPLRLLEQVFAGCTPSMSIEPGTTSQVMTGAPMPDGAEAMVMVENVQREGDSIRIPADIERGQHVMAMATAFARHDVVLKRGTRIRPIEVGLLCEVGRSEVLCHRRPRIAVLPTGDELVPSSEVPGPGQIRNSNGPMLEARCALAECELVPLGIARDDPSQLQAKIEIGLAADILLLSGGVSAGVLDLVPATLRAAGVKEVFHKVRLKPGKPLWFGICERDGHTTLVFGLPGNPVSSLVCFELFVQAAIRALSGLPSGTDMLPVHLAEPYRHRGNRATYYPGKTFVVDGRTSVKLIPWHGSADMLAISRADCFVQFDKGERDYVVGEELLAIGF